MKKKTTTQKEIKKKEIKNFKGIERMTFMCYLEPNDNVRKKKNFREWYVENEGEYSDNVDLVYGAFKNGGKKIQRDLFTFLESYYHLKILPKQKGLKMYHGTRQVLALIIDNDTPYIHYQNKIYSSFNECEDIENDNTHEIKGTYQFLLDHRVWNFKKLLLGLFNEHIK